MIINNAQMDQMHEIQLEIFKSVIEVCEKLGLSYFLVHGSLLGAVMTNKFMPLDDDIDLAMPRADYEILLKEGNELIDKRFFIQSNKTDKNYPLDFGKVRANDTTYIAELLQNIDMNHGMFIDIFPIDNYESSSLKRKIDNLRLKLIKIRISKNFACGKISAKTRILRIFATVMYPSLYKAMAKREKIFSSVKQGELIKLTGGKGKENGIPAEWFKEYETADFEGVQSRVPKMHHEYLSRIYGDYKHRTLLEEKEHSADSVEINACVFDPGLSYPNYLNRGL